MLRVAINGFGRIGRNALKAGWGRSDLKFVAINDLTDPVILAHLLKYDSVFGRFEHEVKAGKGFLSIDGVKIPVTAEKDPALLPWQANKVDVAIEATGFFTDYDGAAKHLAAGAKRVVVSAPAKGVPTYLMGVNHKDHKRSEKVINNASCTTNSVAPIVKVLDLAFGIQKAMLTTIHSATAGQGAVDSAPSGRKPDLRRARSVLNNLIPTSTGAAIAVTEVLPKLKNKFDGVAVRVPTIDVSLSDCTFLLKKKVTVEKINDALRRAAKQKVYRGILGVTDEPLVSSDFIKNPFSAIVDLSMTRVVDGDLVKVMAWYDNEWGYSVHLLDMVANVGRSI